MKCLTKAYDGPHQTTIILSTPFIERKHPTACPTDVFPEVVILVNQSTKDVYIAYSFLILFLVTIIILWSVSTKTNGFTLSWLLQIKNVVPTFACSTIRPTTALRKTDRVNTNAGYIDVRKVCQRR